ncbi:MAG: DUF6659 family protein [Nitrosopumilaceae archaeon]
MSLLVAKKDLHVIHNATILESGVELIGLINKRGRMTEFIGTDKIPLSDSKKEMFLMKIALRTSMQKDFDEELGKVDYCIAKRGSKKYISIPTFDDNTVLVITQKDVNHEKIIEKIIQTINHSEQFLGMPIPNEGEA